MKVSRRALWVSLLTLTGLFAGSILHRTPAITHAADSDITLPGLPIDRSAERYVGSFLDTSTMAMFTRLGVTVYPEDKVFAFPDPKLGVGSTLLVYRAQPVVITDAGTRRVFRTWARTIPELNEEQHLELAAKDKVNLGQDGDVAVQAEPVEVVITRVSEVELPVKTPIAFTTSYTDDPELERGTTITEQSGKAGTLETTYLVRRENGKEVSRKVIKTERLTEPVVQKIRRGTKIVTLDVGKGSFYRACGQNRFTAAHKTLPKGTVVKVINTANGKSVTVTIDDRGPFVTGRVIDLSCDAFAAIASVGSGVISVRVEKP